MIRPTRAGDLPAIARITKPLQSRQRESIRSSRVPEADFRAMWSATAPRFPCSPPRSDGASASVATRRPAPGATAPRRTDRTAERGRLYVANVRGLPGAIRGRPVYCRRCCDELARRGFRSAIAGIHLYERPAGLVLRRASGLGVGRDPSCATPASSSRIGTRRVLPERFRLLLPQGGPAAMTSRGGRAACRRDRARTGSRGRVWAAPVGTAPTPRRRDRRAPSFCSSSS